MGRLETNSNEGTTMRKIALYACAAMTLVLAGTVSVKAETIRMGAEGAYPPFNYVAEDGELKGFTIAGEDKNFHPAEAKIMGDSVVVSSPEVGKPTAVRYAWANVPKGNLFNQAGLPASPFRTDAE